MTFFIACRRWRDGSRKKVSNSKLTDILRKKSGNSINLGYYEVVLPTKTAIAPSNQSRSGQEHKNVKHTRQCFQIQKPLGKRAQFNQKQIKRKIDHRNGRHHVEDKG